MIQLFSFSLSVVYTLPGLASEEAQYWPRMSSAPDTAQLAGQQIEQGLPPLCIQQFSAISGAILGLKSVRTANIFLEVAILQYLPFDSGGKESLSFRCIVSVFFYHSVILTLPQHNSWWRGPSRALGELMYPSPLFLLSKVALSLVDYTHSYSKCKKYYPYKFHFLEGRKFVQY